MFSSAKVVSIAIVAFSLAAFFTAQSLGNNGRGQLDLASSALAIPIALLVGAIGVGGKSILDKCRKIKSRFWRFLTITGVWAGILGGSAGMGSASMTWLDRDSRLDMRPYDVQMDHWSQECADLRGSTKTVKDVQSSRSKLISSCRVVVFGDREVAVYVMKYLEGSPQEWRPVKDGQVTPRGTIGRWSGPSDLRGSSREYALRLKSSYSAKYWLESDVDPSVVLVVEFSTGQAEPSDADFQKVATALRAHGYTID